MNNVCKELQVRDIRSPSDVVEDVRLEVAERDERLNDERYTSEDVENRTQEIQYHADGLECYSHKAVLLQAEIPTYGKGPVFLAKDNSQQANRKRNDKDNEGRGTPKKEFDVRGEVGIPCDKVDRSEDHADKARHQSDSENVFLIGSVAVEHRDVTCAFFDVDASEHVLDWQDECCERAHNEPIIRPSRKTEQVLPNAR